MIENTYDTTLIAFTWCLVLIRRDQFRIRRPMPQVQNNPVLERASKEPSQIDADTLEIFDQEQKAVYKGNVIVKQGETTMKGAKVYSHL